MRGGKYLKLQQRSQTTNEGFTLIELLLAVFIAAIVLGVLYASFFQILKSKDKVEQELELYHEARVIFSKMTKDLATAFPRGSVNSDTNNTASEYFLGTLDGNNSALKFTSLSRLPAENAIESDQTEISYFVVPLNEEDPQLLALVRRDDPTIGTDEGGSEYPITERLVEFNLEYISDISVISGEADITSEWDSNDLSSLPKAVDVRIVLRGPNGEDVAFSSLILIPVVN